MLRQGENVSTCITSSSLAPTEPFSPYVKDTEAAPGLGMRGRRRTCCLGFSDILLFHWIYLDFLFRACYSAFPVFSNADIKFS